MVPLLAKAVVEVTGTNGEHVVIDPPVAIGALYLFLLLLPLIISLLLFFYKKRLRHLQILAAIDKGLPIADLIEKPGNKEVNWVRSLSAGIGFIFIGLALAGFLVWMSLSTHTQSPPPPFWVIPIVVFGMGLIFLFRGILQRNYEKQQKKEKVVPAQ
jgi:hypothetical protein